MANKKVTHLKPQAIPSSGQLLGSWLKLMTTKVRLGKRKELPLLICGNIPD
jgi:hypothetical protein